MLMRLLHECPHHTSERDLREVLAVMAVLAAENDFTTLKAFVSELSDAVLADAVITNLDHLPRREDVCDGVPAPVGPGGLAGLIQVPLCFLSSMPARSNTTTLSLPSLLQPSNSICLLLMLVRGDIPAIWGP